MNLKALMEKRDSIIADLTAMADKTVAETRAFTDNEKATYDAKKAEVENLNSTIKAITEQRSMELADGVIATAGEAETKEQAEERMFVEYVRNGVVNETRADVNWTTGDNGAVIPTSIANKIIRKVVEISPIYEKATKYNVGGTLNIPYYDESSQSITMAYATEFTDLESTSGKFASIQLTGFLAGALCKISKSLVNNSQFDVVNYIVNEIAISCAKWFEKELLKGTASKITGLSGIASAMTVTAASSTAITADELISVQDKVPDAYQGAGIWIMARETRSAIRKLKDGDGNYLLNKDATAKWGYTLFGKPVYVSENMDKMEAGKNAVFYGDFSGLAVKLSENVNIEVLREKYATQHALGVVLWVEMDAKIENGEKIAKLAMKAASGT